MYEEVTYEVILQRMLERISQKFDKREGSVIWDTHSPTAIEFQILYIELDTIIRQSYGDTASREFLILRCKERGIEPYKATKATLKGVFTPTSIELTGKRFNISDLNYVVLDKIADGQYQVRCETAGEIGNQYLGQMIPIEYVDGLETAELVELLIPGEEEEDTESLRERYFNSFDSKAFGGNQKDYIEKTNAIAGVGSTKVTPVWNRDINPSSMTPNTSITAWYQKVIGTLNKDVALWLTNVYMAGLEKKLTTGGTVLLSIINSNYGEASSTLIEKVQETIDPQGLNGEGYGIAPIGHVVSIKSAETIKIYIKIDITFENGYSWSNVSATIHEEVEKYLLELRKDWANVSYLVTRISQIETRILAIVGILDVTNTKINGVASNLTLTKYQIPILGGVSA